MSADIEKAAAERFRRDTAEHVMTVLHDDGLYRHLRCAKPDSSTYWFEVVTWPGALAFRGDMDGAPVFSRVTDMFQFFRANGTEHGINPHYWAEKMPDGGKSVRVYSEDQLRAKVAAALAEYKEEFPRLKADHSLAKSRYDVADWADRWPMKGSGPRDPGELTTPAGARQIVTNHDEDGLLSFADGARQLLRELEAANVVADTFEWDLTDWDWAYLWACHAIVWAIARYDEQRVTTVEVPGVSR